MRRISVTEVMPVANFRFFNFWGPVSYDNRAMGSNPQSDADLNGLKVGLVQANLETAIDFAKIALQSDEESDVVRYKRKACNAYEEALHSLRTAVLTHIEWETIRTKMEHLESVLTVSNGTSDVQKP